MECYPTRQGNPLFRLAQLILSNMFWFEMCSKWIINETGEKNISQKTFSHLFSRCLSLLWVVYLYIRTGIMPCDWGETSDSVSYFLLVSFVQACLRFWYRSLMVEVGPPRSRGFFFCLDPMSEGVGAGDVWTWLRPHLEPWHMRSGTPTMESDWPPAGCPGPAFPGVYLSGESPDPYLFRLLWVGPSSMASNGANGFRRMLTSRYNKCLYIFRSCLIHLILKGLQRPKHVGSFIVWLPKYKEFTDRSLLLYC